MVAYGNDEHSYRVVHGMVSVGSYMVVTIYFSHGRIW